MIIEDGTSFEGKQGARVEQIQLFADRTIIGVKSSFHRYPVPGLNWEPDDN